MAVPDEVYRNGSAEQGQLRPGQGTGGGVLSAAQASAGKSGADQHGAQAGGIDPRRDKPRVTPECPGCGTCQPSGSAGYVFGSERATQWH